MAWLKVVEALKAQPGEQVTVKGWIRTRRDSKADGGLSFLAVHDGTCFDAVQVVAKADLPNYASEVAKLTTHCAVECDGVIAAGPKGGSEIQATAVRVVGWVDDPDHYPIQPKQHSFEYLREVAHLRVRTNTFGAVARVRHCLAMAVHRYFHERGFYWVHTPIITGSDCEGAGQMFRVSTLDMVNLPRMAEGAKGQRGRGASGAGPPQPVSPSAPQPLCPYRFLPRLLRQRSPPHRLRPAQRRDVRERPLQRLYLWPHLPRREQQHRAPPRRVLDDRTRDGLLRPHARFADR